MENKNIKLLYNKKTIELELPSTYDEFMKLLEDKLYLTEELVRNAKIVYYDQDNDNNFLGEDNYEASITDNNGNWEMEVDFYTKPDDLTPNGNNDDNKLGKNVGINKEQLKEIEKKIAKKVVKLYEAKMKKKEEEHNNEISKIKEDFENVMNTAITKNESQINDLSEYYNKKLKEYFENYNKMIINNINTGISESEINNLYEKFIKENNLNDDNIEEEMKISRLIK